MMTYLARLRKINLRTVAAALITVGILHICAVFAAPETATATAYMRLAGTLPLNKMVMLPPVTPAGQPLPFLSPDARYAMCRFESLNGPVAVNASLLDSGWTLAIHSSAGDNLYTATTQGGGRTEISLLLVPSEDRFVGLGIGGPALATPQSSGKALTLPASEGIIVLRAPDKGTAYRPAAEAVMKRADCVQKPQ